MTRKLLLSMSLLTAGACFAAPLTPEEALSRLGNDALLTGTRSAAGLAPALTLQTPVGEPALYVFNQADTPGFIVVSADDAVTPVLGYSDFNSLDVDNMPPALQTWLDQYSRQIDYIRVNNVGASSGTSGITLPSWSAIAPLLKSTWNQENPYNKLCPVIDNTLTPTGCVATSMSQVMYYFQYPEKPKGNVSYRYNYQSSTGQTLTKALSLDLSTVTLDWANMLPSYTGNYSNTQGNAVATLMQAAGYSVYMSYTPNYSGAVSGYIPGALINNFGYDPSCYYLSRSMKTYTEWATLIYNNLKNIGPVIYDGDTADSGGHSFVCDGYNGNGYFHFNWGWGGAGDGYFLLDSLNPSAIGVGGALGGFDFQQDVVLNIQKPKSGSVAAQGNVVLSGSVSGGISSSFLRMQVYGASLTGFRYYGDSQMPIFDTGLEFSPVSGNGETFYATCTNNETFQGYPYQPLDPGIIMYFNGINYPFPMFLLSGLNLQDGVKYKATAAIKPTGGDWIEVEAGVGDYNYFYITKENGSYTIENMDQMQFSCTEMKLASDLYYTKASEVDITLVNNNDTELTRSAIPVLVDSNNNIAFMGDSYVQSIAPGNSVKMNVVTPWNNLGSSTVNTATPYYLGLYDLDTETVYYKSENTVTMNPNPGQAIYETSITINNGEWVPVDQTTGAGGYFMVENAQDIEATVTVKVTKGIFSSPISVYGGYTVNDRLYVSLTYPLDLRIINEGESDEFTLTVNYSSATPGDVYYLIADVDNDYNINGDTDVVAFIAKTNESGVEELASSTGDMIMLYDKVTGLLKVMGGQGGVKNVEVYQLNGIKAGAPISYNNGVAEVDLTSVGKGVVMVTAQDGQGHRKTMKLAL